MCNQRQLQHSVLFLPTWKVIESPIVAVLFAGGVSQIAIGVGQNFTMDPESLSIDPDDPTGSQVRTKRLRA